MQQLYMQDIKILKENFSQEFWLQRIKSAQKTRLELLSALLLSRLTKNIIEALNIRKIVRVYQLVDSSSTIGMIRKKSEALQEFCGVRIGEIKRNTDEMLHKIPTFWFWIPREGNVADIPSKGTLDNAVLESKYWQEGPEFLKTSEDQWPVKPGEQFAAPNEEVKVTTCHIVQNKKSKKQNILYELATKCRSLKKMLNVTAFILRLFQYKGKKKSPLDNEDIARARKFWEDDFMKLSKKTLKVSNYKPLRWLCGVFRKTIQPCNEDRV